VSNINYLGINENFPVAGEDNDTQVFRDNFDTIKTSLQTAKDEITDLQDNVVRTDILENDFKGTVISRAIMQNTYERKADNGTVSGNFGIELDNGSYHIISCIGNTNLNFLEFPNTSTVPESVGKVTIEIYGVPGSTVTFVEEAGYVYKKSANFPNPLILPGGTEDSGPLGGNPIIIEAWRHRDDRIFLNYLGQFSS